MADPCASKLNVVAVNEAAFIGTLKLATTVLDTAMLIAAAAGAVVPTVGAGAVVKVQLKFAARGTAAVLVAAVVTVAV